MNIDPNVLTQVVMTIRRQRLEKTCRVVKAFVKQSGGWSKAFPDKSANYPKFDLYSKTGEWCLEELRMLSGDIEILRQHLGIPIEFRTSNRDSASGLDALCMLLYRLCRYGYMRSEKIILYHIDHTELAGIQISGRHSVPLDTESGEFLTL
jgi:hypothetical protein